jgi:hypothetical protein
MAQPDRPNFSFPARFAFGFIALVMIYLLLQYLGYLPAFV